MIPLITLVFISTLFLAYANGANDNFKGVATLFGSGTTNYRRALAWATVTTLAGSMTAAFFATKLAKVFSGKGLVPDGLLTSPPFLVAITGGAALTVLLASVRGIPISTTHSLTGALAGVGLVSAGKDFNFAVLGKNFFVPLAISPLLALALAALIYSVVARTRKKLGYEANDCLCVRQSETLAVNPSAATVALQTQPAGFDLVVDREENCQVERGTRFRRSIPGIPLKGLLSGAHYLSAGAVGFSRGLNDAPKIVAIALAAGFFDIVWLTFAAAGIMALGGLIQAKAVAKTMSKDITPLNEGQGFTANAITAVLVIFASKWGMPVSTTHVSCGSLFGIGLSNGQAHWKVIGGIALAWLLTLPVAALIATGLFLILR